MPSSHLAIVHLLYTYAERIDRGDFEGVADLFTHGSITAEGRKTGVTGREAVLAMYTRTTRRYEDGTPHTKHLVTNPIVVVDEAAGTATCRSYFTVFQQVDGLSLQPVIAGRYQDRFECVDRAWRFSHRHIVSDLFGDLSRHLLIDLTRAGTNN